MPGAPRSSLKSRIGRRGRLAPGRSTGPPGARTRQPVLAPAVGDNLAALAPGPRDVPHAQALVKAGQQPAAAGAEGHAGGRDHLVHRVVRAVAPAHPAGHRVPEAHRVRLRAGHAARSARTPRKALTPASLDACAPSRPRGPSSAHPRRGRKHARGRLRREHPGVPGVVVHGLALKHAQRRRHAVGGLPRAGAARAAVRALRAERGSLQRIGRQVEHAQPAPRPPQRPAGAGRSAPRPRPAHQQSSLAVSRQAPSGDHRTPATSAKQTLGQLRRPTPEVRCGAARRGARLSESLSWGTAQAWRSCLRGSPVSAAPHRLAQPKHGSRTVLLLNAQHRLVPAVKHKVHGACVHETLRVPRKAALGLGSEATPTPATDPPQHLPRTLLECAPLDRAARLAPGQF